MRKIKFRGKSIETGKWVMGWLILLEYPYRLCIANRGCPDNWHQTAFIDVDPATVGQFTELQDKNGVEIYEGDVLHYCPGYDESEGGQIGAELYEVKMNNAMWEAGVGMALIDQYAYCAVIGNIHGV